MTNKQGIPYTYIPQNWSHRRLEGYLYSAVEPPKYPSALRLFDVLAMRGRDTYSCFPLIEVFVERNPIPVDLNEYRDNCQAWVSTILSKLYRNELSLIKEPTLQSVETLAPRWRDVLRRRFGLNDERSRTFQELADVFDVDPTRIQQIEKRALRDARRHLLVTNNLRTLRQSLLRLKASLYDQLTESASLRTTTLCLTLFSEAPCFSLIEPAINAFFGAEYEQVLTTRAHYLERSRHLSNEDIQWLCGFWEGDGSLSATVGLTFNQKDRRILEYIRQLLQYPRHILYPSPTHNTTTSTLFLRGESMQVLLDRFCKWLVCKGRVRQVEELSDELRLNLKPKQHTPTIPWIAGFFDAEGCVYRSGPSLYAKFSQKDRTVLDSIQEVVGGHISRWELTLRKRETREFWPHWLKYSHNPQKQERLYKLLQEAERLG